MITHDEVARLIRAAIPDAAVEVRDMTGTGDHLEIQVVSSSFTGKTLVEQHRAVFACLEAEMDRRIHAVKLKTRAAAP